MEFRDPHVGIGRVPTVCAGRRLTKLAFGPDVDINAIMKKYLASGILTHLNRHPPRYGDFATVSDYLDAQVRVKSAEALFRELPAKVRAACEGSPAKFLELVLDPANRARAEELQLVTKAVDVAQASAAADAPDGAGAA